MMKTLLLVDGSSYLYRAFHALAPLTSPQGEPTNALFGVLNMLRRLKQETPHDYAAVIFDAKGKNFRHALYPEYKATRPPMPDDLRLQVEWVHELTALSGWHVLSVPNVEADDVIATLARQAEKQQWQVIISSGDKDLTQLVNEQITMVDTMQHKAYDIAGVIEKFGVTPQQIVDYLTLVGDTADHIPGVMKCGPKTAVKWVQEYQNLDNLLANADKITGKIGENLRLAIPQLPLSKQLITLKEDVDLSSELPHGLEDLIVQEPQWQALSERLRYFGFRALLKDVEKHISQNNQDLFRQPESISETISQSNRQAESISETISQSNRQAEHFRQPENILVTEHSQWQEVLSRFQSASCIALHLTTTSPTPMDAKIIGIGVAFDENTAFYLPLAHTGSFTETSLDENTVLPALKPFLENPHLQKIGYDLKTIRHVLANYDIRLDGMTHDVMLASYLLESHQNHQLSALLQRHFPEYADDFIDEAQLCGKGSKAISFADVDLNSACNFACQNAIWSWRLADDCTQQFTEAQKNLYQNMEMPMIEILFAMERTGILLDKNELYRQSQALGSLMLDLEQQAYKEAGQPFNLNSPKQLSTILFEHLAIPTQGIKKTANGGFSTNESVLEKLALNYALPQIILENRGLSKLKSTYTDKLPLLADHQNRIHTSYAQAVAVTGRLASNHPNLQNIPIRTKEGRKIRRAFIADSGCLLLSADYSQIELRIMAHLSGDLTLLQSFQNNEDVHRRTAAEIFFIPPESVTADQRRYAKTVNFGLIYGMGVHGLAESLKITHGEAKMFIDRYFARYPQVLAYMENTKNQARQEGFVETLFGRRLYLPDIHSDQARIRAMAERAAINAPMQGTASDLIKLAMIGVTHFLNEGNFQTQLLLQVHDELIFEVPENEIDTMQNQLPEIMSAVGKNVLQVPLLVETGIGKNWDEAH